jgi:2-hydroxy-6-oxonona-2,4-dienedioate hydrolase
VTSQVTITRFDQRDRRVVAAIEAEQRLFAHYGLDYTIHHVDLKQPDLRVRVLEVGSGPPLLLVPGGSGDAWQLAPLMAQLPGWRLIAVNRPGGGMSDGIDHRQVDLRRLAVQTLSAVLDAFALPRIPVIANSMGGLWSFWLALDRPERVSALVQLGCPALLLNTSAPFFMRLLCVPLLQRLLVANLQPNSRETALNGLKFQGSSQAAITAMPDVLGDAAYHFFQLPTFRDTWITLVSATATLTGAKRAYQLGSEQLQRLQQPVCFLWGDHDPFGSLDVAHQAVGIVPTATLHELHAGHLPFLDNPTACGQHIRTFLASLKSCLI